MNGLVGDILTRWRNQYKSNFFLQKLSSLLGVDILAKSFTIFLLPIYLWVMTQEEYGIYNYIITIVTTFSVILNFGLYVSQSKYYSDAHSTTEKGTVLFNIFLLLTSFLTVVTVSVYATGLDYWLVGIIFKNDINYPAYRWLILLAVLTTVYTLIFTNFYIISEKIILFRRYNISKMIAVNLIVVAALFFYKTDKIYVRLLHTYIAELLLLLLFGIAYFREMNVKIDKQVMRSSLRLGMPIMFGAIWSLLSNYSDKFFLEKYGTARHLSYYYLAFSISNILLMICTAVQNAWLPTFLKEKDVKKNISNTKKLINRLVILLIILGVLLLTGLYICLKVHIISEKYWPSIYITPILLVAQILNGILTIYGSYVIYFEKTHWALFVGIATSIIGLLSSYFLIPTLNVYGAALVYLIVQLTYLTIYYFLIQRRIKMVTLASGNVLPGTNVE